MSIITSIGLLFEVYEMSYDIGSLWNSKESDEPYMLVEFNRRDHLVDVALVGFNTGNRWHTPVTVSVHEATGHPAIHPSEFELLCSGTRFRRTQPASIPKELNPSELRFSTCWKNDNGTFMLTRLHENMIDSTHFLTSAAMIDMKTGVAVNFGQYLYEYNDQSKIDTKLVTPEFWDELNNIPLLYNLERVR